MKKILLISILVLTLLGCTQKQEKTLSIPDNLSYENNLISFDEVPFATSYIININGEEIEITSNNYTVNFYGEVRVKVKARAEGYQDSPYTNELVFLIPLNLPPIRFNYSIHTSFDLLVYTFEEGVTITNVSSITTTITSNDYIYTNNQLYLKSSFLKTLNTQVQEFTFSLGDLGTFDVIISINQTTLPYLISYNTIDYTSDDITLLYELFTGSITRLSGNGITIDDYVITENTVTIKSSFIDLYFTSNPTETTLSLKYDLKLGDSYIFGYIFIKK